jgi:hypothetical protein
MFSVLRAGLGSPAFDIAKPALIIAKLGSAIQDRLS